MTFGSNGILNSQNESNTYTFNENLLMMKPEVFLNPIVGLH